jgi:glycosyltransferase involved in cell wall biosynthesis
MTAETNDIRATGLLDVSVVIPTYNRSATLRRALKSVLAQTRRPDEVIVVDDGSTDDTAGWVERDFPRVTYIRQRNKGVSAARNRGVAAAGREWIAFLDSDDEWRPQKLERQLSALAENTDYHLCHTNETWIRDGRRVNERKRHAKSGGWIFQRCLPLCVISPSAAVVRRSLLDELGGFDESMPVCEDYDMWLSSRAATGVWTATASTRSRRFCPGTCCLRRTAPRPRARCSRRSTCTSKAPASEARRKR